MNCKKMPLSECIEIIGGGTPKTSKKEYWGGEIPWLSVVDFNNDNRYVSKTEKTITQEGLDNCSSHLLGESDIILSARGTVGALAQLSKPMAFNQSCYGIRANNLAINDYVYYMLKHSVSVLKKNSYGSVFDTITRETFSRIEVLLPDLKTQKKISEVLGSIDNKIELNGKINQNLDWEDYFSICRKIIELEEKNQNLEAQAQAIFKSWFVDFEPFKNGKFVDSELGKIPEGWTVKELGEVSKNIREKVASRTNTPVLSAVKEGRLILSEEYFSKQVYSKSLSKYIVVKENEYAYNPARVNIGSLGRNTMYPLGCVSPVYVVFKIDDDYLAFFDLYFKMDSFKKEVKLRASGSVRQTLSYDDFSLIKVIYPPKSVSSAFNKLSMVSFEKITRNNEESRRLSQLRDTLLPKLMSGEIDVSDVAV